MFKYTLKELIDRFGEPILIHQFESINLIKVSDNSFIFDDDGIQAVAIFNVSPKRSRGKSMCFAMKSEYWYPNEGCRYVIDLLLNSQINEK